MTQEETQANKKLLLKDFCARLPYGVVGQCEIDASYDTPFDTIPQTHKFNAVVARQNHLKATHLVDMDEKRTTLLKDGRRLRIADLFTYEGFKEHIRRGEIDKCDGYGYWAYEDKVSDLAYEFYAGDDEAILEKYGFTHILWFNR